MSEPEMVERKARIFRFGHYPGKHKGRDWGITREAFVAANGETGTVPVGLDPINLKHYEGRTSILDGSTGTAEFSVEGDEVHATVRLPKWLDEVRRKVGLKISSVIGVAGNDLRKIDLVDRPHVKDAVFFADGHGDVVVFEDDEPEAAGFAGDDKGDIAQMHHDMASMCMPGLCKPESVKFADEAEADRGLRMIHDHAVHEGGAYCPGMDHDHHHGEVGMSDLIEEIEYDLEEAVVSFTDEQIAELPGRDQQTIRLMRKLQRQNEKLAEDNARKDAVTFADSVTKGEGRRAYPMERKTIIDGYLRNASLDARLGDTVTFSDGREDKTGSHLDAFKASVLVRPVLKLNAEGVVGFDLAIQPDLGADPLKELDEETRAFGSRMNGPRK